MNDGQVRLILEPLKIQAWHKGPKCVDSYGDVICIPNHHVSYSQSTATSWASFSNVKLKMMDWLHYWDLTETGLYSGEKVPGHTKEEIIDNKRCRNAHEVSII